MFTKNNIQITGNITRDPETREVGETTVTSARLIHNEKFKKSDGATAERVVAVDVEVWGKRGEAFAEYVNPKVPVCVEGKLQLDQWEQDGAKRSRLVVRVEDWQFLMAKTGGEEADGKATRKGGASKKAAA